MFTNLLSLFITLFIICGPLAFFWLVRSTNKREKYRPSKRFRVEETRYDPDDPIYQFVEKLKQKKANTSNVDVNTRLVRECTQILSPVTASARDVIRLHRCLCAYNEFDLIIKMSVHYNLFSRAIKALGTKKHLKILKSMTNIKKTDKNKNKNNKDDEENKDNNNDSDDDKEFAQIGAFALTERGAGVLSGFVVETTARYDKDSKNFVINTPNARARKYWISQGRTCDYMIVYCKLIFDGKEHGIHAFLIKMNDYDIKTGDYGFIDHYVHQKLSSCFHPSFFFFILAQKKKKQTQKKKLEISGNSWK